MSCKRFFHLSCLGDDFEVTRFCHQCRGNDSEAEETSESEKREDLDVKYFSKAKFSCKLKVLSSQCYRKIFVLNFML